MPIRIKVFVYGSLKKGFYNSSIMRSAIFLSDVVTVKEFGMFKDDFGNYPYIVDKPYMQVQGELYSVSEELLGVLDRFESVPDYYHRKLIEVTGSDNMIYSAFCYFQKEECTDKECLSVWVE